MSDKPTRAAGVYAAWVNASSAVRAAQANLTNAETDFASNSVRFAHDNAFGMRAFRDALSNAQKAYQTAAAALQALFIANPDQVRVVGPIYAQINAAVAALFGQFVTDKNGNFIAGPTTKDKNGNPVGFPSTIGLGTVTTDGQGNIVVGIGANSVTINPTTGQTTINVFGGAVNPVTKQAVDANGNPLFVDANGNPTTSATDASGNPNLSLGTNGQPFNPNFKQGGFNSLNYPVGTPGYADQGRALIALAREIESRLANSPRSGPRQNGAQVDPNALDDEEVADLEAQDAQINDFINDFNTNQEYGTTAKEKAGQKPPADVYDQPKLAILHRALFAVENGAPGYPLAHETLGAKYVDPRAVNKAGAICAQGWFKEDDDFVRPIVPLPDASTIPTGEDPKKKTGKPGGGKKKPPEGKCKFPPIDDPNIDIDHPVAQNPTGGGAGGPSTPGQPKQPGDGEPSPCDQPPHTSNPGVNVAGAFNEPGGPIVADAAFTPGAETSLVDANGDFKIDEAPGYDALMLADGRGDPAFGAFGDQRAPGVRPQARYAATYGLSAIQPTLPVEAQQPGADQRTLFGGGPYAPSMSNVPRGGIRSITAFDFSKWHTIDDVQNFVVRKVNQLVAFVNDMAPFADRIDSRGSHIPDQAVAPDPNDGRYRTGDEVQVNGMRMRLVPRMLGQVGALRPRTGTRTDGKQGALKEWSAVSHDKADSRTHGARVRGRDIVTRYDTGEPSKSGRGRPGDRQPKQGWSGTSKRLFTEGADVEHRADRVVRVASDGTENDLVGAINTDAAGTGSAGDAVPVFDAAALTANRILAIKNADGTLALTSDVLTSPSETRTAANGATSAAIATTTGTVLIDCTSLTGTYTVPLGSATANPDRRITLVATPTSGLSGTISVTASVGTVTPAAFDATGNAGRTYQSIGGNWVAVSKV